MVPFRKRGHRGHSCPGSQVKGEESWQRPMQVITRPIFADGEFQDGEIFGIRVEVKGCEPVELLWGTLSEEVRDFGLFAGFHHRFVDAMSLPKKEDGSVASPQEKHAVALALRDHYASGTAAWDLPKGPRMPKVAPEWDVVEAIALQKGEGWDHERADKFVSALAAKRGIERSALLDLLRQDKEVKLGLLSLESQRLAAKEREGDSLLDGEEDE